MTFNISNYDKLLKEIYEDVLNISNSKDGVELDDSNDSNESILKEIGEDVLNISSVQHDVELDDNNYSSGEKKLVDEESNVVSNRLKHNWLLINQQNDKNNFLSYVILYYVIWKYGGMSIFIQIHLNKYII